MEARDTILWAKMRVWQLEDYEKVIMLDADLLILRNVDELFQLPELSGTPLLDPREKIQFFKTAEYGLRQRNKIDRKKPTGLQEGWSGLNSGVTVVQPSNKTFTDMLNELSIIPNRPCCPSQEFIYNFFEERKRYYRIPFVYNTRVLSEGSPQPSSNTKIYHFVGSKPWKKRDPQNMLNAIWWMFKDAVDTKLGSA
jgi:lipopolysaccharide biosynthesis glycosyltransferase